MEGSDYSAAGAQAPARWSTHAVETAICEVWRELFGAEVSPYADFFDLGGDSITILDMVSAARRRGLPLRSSLALRHPTPARLAERLTLEDGAPFAAQAAVPPALSDSPAPRGTAPPFTRAIELTTILAGGAAAPLFVLHSTDQVAAEQAAVRSWFVDRPAVGVLPPGLRAPGPGGEQVETIAQRCLAELRRAQPAGPYYLVGFGHAAVLAFALAAQLHREHEPVAAVALVRPPALAGSAPPTEPPLPQRLTSLARRFGLTGDESVTELLALLRQAGWYDPDVAPDDLPRLQRVWAELVHAVSRYRPEPYPGPLLVCQDVGDGAAVEQSWRATAPRAVFEAFDYHLESPQPLLADPRLAELMRKELTP